MLRDTGSRLAAGLLLAGRVWPEALAPEHVDGAAWPINHPDAQEVLVATVRLGARYRGWARALRVAEREMADEGRSS